jgi:hypothetical protein
VVELNPVAGFQVKLNPLLVTISDKEFPSHIAPELTDTVGLTITKTCTVFVATHVPVDAVTV